jgi:hypothetical protein
VELLAEELRENGPVTAPVYDRIGRHGTAADVGSGEPVAVCLDAIPPGMHV